MSIFNKSRVIIANNSKLYSEMVASASHFLFFASKRKGILVATSMGLISYAFLSLEPETAAQNCPSLDRVIVS